MCGNGFFDPIPIPLLLYKNIPSRNNILIPIPALSIRSFKLFMIN